MGDVLKMLAHQIGPQCAVHAQHVHFIKREHAGDDGGDVRAGQHRTLLENRHLHHHRNALAGFFHRDVAGGDGGLHLQKIESSLDQKRIGAAGQQAAALLGVGVFKDVIGREADAGHLGRRADGADHITRPIFRLEFSAGLAGNLRAALVQIKNFVCDAVFGEGDFVPIKRVRLHRIAADGQEALVNFANDFRPGLNENLGAVFVAEIILLNVEVVGVNAGAHSAVEEDDALTDEIE